MVLPPYDSALLDAFGRRGLGLFAAPAAIEREGCAELQVQPVGRTEEVRERYYAISVERRLRHPAVVAIAERPATAPSADAPPVPLSFGPLPSRPARAK